MDPEGTGFAGREHPKVGDWDPQGSDFSNTDRWCNERHWPFNKILNVYVEGSVRSWWPRLTHKQSRCLVSCVCGSAGLWVTTRCLLTLWLAYYLNFFYLQTFHAMVININYNNYISDLIPDLYESPGVWEALVGIWKCFWSSPLSPFPMISAFIL